MRKRHQIVALIGILFTAQAFLSWYFFLYLNNLITVTEGRIIFFATVLISGIVDFSVARLLFGRIDRSADVYAAEVAQRLGVLLESYRTQTEQEKKLAKRVSLAVSSELEAARNALTEGNVHEMDRHLSAALDATLETPYSTCENVVIAAVLDSKTRQCAETGIILATYVSIPESLPLDELEVASVFFDLIEDAQYRCERYVLKGNANNLEPRIVVRSWIQAGQLFVEVTSPRGATHWQRRVKRHKTTNAESTLGPGTNIASSITGKHHGVFESVDQEDHHTTSVLIPLPQ